MACKQVDQTNRAEWQAMVLWPELVHAFDEHAQIWHQARSLRHGQYGFVLKMPKQGIDYAQLKGLRVRELM